MDLFNLPSFITHDHWPRGSPAHSELGPPINIISQENAPGACPQDNLVGTFSQLRSLFHKDSSLFQADIKLASSDFLLAVTVMCITAIEKLMDTTTNNCKASLKYHSLYLLQQRSDVTN